MGALLVLLHGLLAAGAPYIVEIALDKLMNVPLLDDLPDSADNRLRSLLGRSPAGAVTMKKMFSALLYGFSADMSTAGRSYMALHGATVETDQIIFKSADSVASWGLDRIDQANLPLDQTYAGRGTGADTHIFVVDTGINAAHREFAGRVGDGFDAVSNDNDPEDWCARAPAPRACRATQAAHGRRGVGDG